MDGLFRRKIHPVISIILLFSMTAWVCFFYVRETSKIYRGDFSFSASEYYGL